MQSAERLRPEQVLEDYFRAKDGNRPHLLAGVFAPDATLEVHNQSSSISFPAITHGSEAIANVLVRRFTQTYENIYSFYLARPPAAAAKFDCPWLVGMSEKASGLPRVGCGRYAWTFQDAERGLASTLVISIDAMEVLPQADALAVFAWLERLNYPWASAETVKSLAPPVPALEPVLACLGRGSGAG